MKKPKNAFEASMETANKGTKGAVDHVKKMFGIPEDESVRLYQRLKPEDFPKLIEKFGEDATLEYIRRMETRLQKQ